MKVSARSLVQALINASEKGARIARVIRAESALLELLVQEKKGDQKNYRFVQDFKTLADVLVQETVRHDLSEQFPGIGDSIYGEESNKFTNVLGESISVRLLKDQEATAQLLCSVLDDNMAAASTLARVAHEQVLVDVGPRLEDVSVDLDLDDLGVWIDPIDSTAQYINGQCGVLDKAGLISCGLQCVVVLIGVYSQSSGLPLIGVCNRPFADSNGDKWKGDLMWGVAINECRVFSLPHENTYNFNKHNLAVLMSQSEKADVQKTFLASGSVHHAAGAGYKLLCVNQGLADAYVLSKSSTFFWDVCAPHAILLAQKGGVISYKSLCDFKDDPSSCAELSLNHQIVYHHDNNRGSGAQKFCNQEGIVAYGSLEALKAIIQAVRGV
ncbi:inositol polyphosphate 1-phosphatase-like [Saccostrea echinata]|uniref:inositol polyphosphate 1-phosphatase-like n=1 Tax=Saccostrea echinata TaxID=191078 RepID=UPI002A83350C|nr:inositol polyphosphate 1-phosphatase-like [Saccostrea echinata]XP_061185940.1 inositol polyphosphate 1-phosphatase-like [Saccostrea echinata]